MNRLSRDVQGLGASLKIETALVIGNDAIDHTPVDTGETVSSWQGGVGGPPAGFRPPYSVGSKGNTADANKTAAKAALKAAISSAPPGIPVFISNAAPAIVPLNSGSSSQEPAGFKERAIVKGRLYLKRRRGGGTL